MRELKRLAPEAVSAGLAEEIKGVSGSEDFHFNSAGRRLGKRRRYASVLALLMMCGFGAEAQQNRGIYDPSARRQPVRRARPETSAPSKRGRAADIQNGRSCTVVTFEGLGDIQPIPTFEGITSPNWLSLIEGSVGGSGNFSNEPSWFTTAFWLDPSPSQDILFAKPMSNVSFYYASLPGLGLTAYDAGNNVVAFASGAPNYDYDNNTYNQFWPIGVDAGSNKITKIRISGGVNRTGIDDFKVCRVIAIESVEVTQAIQQWQTLSDLKTSLSSTQEPPVPIISGKPAVLRVYMDEVTSVAPVTVRISGVYSETKPWVLPPNCPTVDQRAKKNVCNSIDFYFTPPTGSWQATLEVLDSGGNVLQQEVLNFKSRDTNSLKLRAVSICDAKDGGGNWLCAPAASLLTMTGLAAKIFPTKSVTSEVTTNVVRRDTAVSANMDAWWNDAIGDVNSNYGIVDTIADALASRRTTYYGMIRPGLSGGTGGMANGIPSNGAGSRTSATRLGVETNVEVVAHETGHTLGLKHTNTNVPVAAAAPPGCYNLAQDPSTDWPYADNRIQSATGVEYGFDVASRTVIDPNVTYDILSYCVPRWISPQRYKTAIATLGGGAVTTPSAVRLAASAQPASGAAAPQARAPQPRAIVTGPFWSVRGTIVSGAVQFAPVFQQTVQASNDAGTGSYRIEEQAANSTVLFTRNVTPTVAHAETSGASVDGNPSFNEFLPVTAGVAAIVVKNAGSVEIGRITFSGRPLWWPSRCRVRASSERASKPSRGRLPGRFSTLRESSIHATTAPPGPGWAMFRTRAHSRSTSRIFLRRRRR